METAKATSESLCVLAMARSTPHTVYETTFGRMEEETVWIVRYIHQCLCNRRVSPAKEHHSEDVDNILFPREETTDLPTTTSGQVLVRAGVHTRRGEEGG